jgi:Domain of unknown function (DUF4384)
MTQICPSCNVNVLADAATCWRCLAPVSGSAPRPSGDGAAGRSDQGATIYKPGLGAEGPVNTQQVNVHIHPPVPPSPAVVPRTPFSAHSPIPGGCGVTFGGLTFWISTAVVLACLGLVFSKNRATAESTPSPIPAPSVQVNIQNTITGGSNTTTTTVTPPPAEVHPTKSAISRLTAAPMAVPSAATLEAASQPIPFNLTTDRPTYREDEVVPLTLTSAKAGHLRLFYKDAIGEVTCLFPTEALTEEAARLKHPLNDTIPAGRPVVVSGPESFTGIEVVIAGPHFGAEEIAAVLTEYPIQADAAFLKQLKSALTATEAARLVAAEAIRQDYATKSARSQLSQGVPEVLTGVGIQTVQITTRTKG